MDVQDRSLFEYAAFGVRLSSDLKLPEFDPSAVPSLGHEISVRSGPVPEGGLGLDHAIGPFTHAKASMYWLSVPGVGRFLSANGTSITYERHQNLPDLGLFTRILCGPALAALMLQRRHLVLNAGAVSVGGRGLVIAGVSGIGKSTLAAALMKAGHSVVSDDVCVLDDHGRIIPSIPSVLLWKSALAALGFNAGGLPSIRPGIDKFIMPLEDAFTSEPTPMTALYRLATHLDNSFVAKDHAGVATFSTLRESSYLDHAIDKMGLGATHLGHSARIAAQVPIVTVLRPRGGFLLDELAEFIINDFERRWTER